MLVVLVLCVPMAHAAPEAQGKGGDPSISAGEPSHFASQAEAIDYFVAKAQGDSEDEKDATFWSQAEPLKLYVPRAQRDPKEEKDVTFSSQAEAIDFYVALNQCEQEDPVSFSSQAEAIDYFVGKAEREKEFMARGSLACIAVN